MNAPWLSNQVIEFIKELKPKTVFEFGSGYSTIFLENIAEKLVSIDHDIRWYKKIKPELKKTEYHLIHPEKYPEFIKKYNIIFELTLVDGIQREKCILNSIKNSKIIILDDSEKEKYNSIKTKMKKYHYKTLKENNNETTIWKIK